MGYEGERHDHRGDRDRLEGGDGVVFEGGDLRLVELECPSN